MTLILEVDQHFPQPGIVEHALEIIKDTHGLIVYPTDTVYGVGCDATDPVALAKLEELRGKRTGSEAQKSFSMMVADLKMLERYAALTNEQRAILKEYLPGPFTFILKSSSKAPVALVSAHGTIGIRIPRNRLCKALVKGLKKPLITTSFNLPGEPVVTNPTEAPQALRDAVDVILDAETLATTASTVVDLTQTPPQILRQGAGIFKYSS